MSKKEIGGKLPLIIDSSQGELEDYQVYGKTVENLFDYTATDPNNGYLNGYLLNDEGDPYAVSGCYGSEYIELGGNTDYTLVIRTSSGSYDLYFCLYDSNHNKSRVLSCNTYATFTTLSTEKYIRFSSPNSLASKTMLTKGSTAPTRYVPYGTPDGLGVPVVFLNQSVTIEANTASSVSVWGLWNTVPANGKFKLKYTQNQTLVSNTRNTPLIVLSDGTYIYKSTSENEQLNAGDYEWEFELNYDNLYITQVKYWCNCPSQTTFTNISLSQLSPSSVSYTPAGYEIPILNTSGNLWNGEIEQGGINNGGSLVESAMRVRSCITNLVGGQTYFIKSNQNIRMIYAYYGGWTDTKIGLVLDNNTYKTEYTFKLPERANSIGVALMTYPETNIVPSDVTTAILANSSNYDLFIGDTKLYEDEHLDFATQKVYKLKEVHKDTVTVDGVVWDILGYDHDEVYDGEGNLAQHSVTIQTHDCIAALQFDTKEALFAFPNGLSAGTYHFTVSQQPWYAGDVGKSMQFTLQKDIPINGVIVLGNAYNTTMINSTISIYISPSSTVANETAIISEGSGGTDLGFVDSDISGNINSIYRAFWGNNNYYQSAIRQYLNADDTSENYWTPQNKWDRPPSWNSSQAGFLNEYSINFKNAIGITKKITTLSSTDGGGTETTNEKVFLLSQTEVYCGGSEGIAYSYYSNYSDLPSVGTGNDTNRIKTLSSTATIWVLRTPYSNPSYERNITTTGAYQYSGASDSQGVAPAVCIPLDNIDNDPYLQSLFLKPTNPPAPLPEISLYEGKNTLTSTEDIKKMIVTYGNENISTVEINNTFYDINDIFARGMIADEYNNNLTYTIGDFCYYCGFLYRCINNCSGNWNSDNWEQTTLANILKGFNITIEEVL